MKIQFVLAVMLTLLPFTGFTAAVPCTDGSANGFECSHVDFVARLSASELGGAPGEDLNDVWGWVDEDGTEYALVGMFGGTAFVRLDGDNPPQFLGRLPDSDGMVAASGSIQQKSCHDEACGSDSSWRDIKVYKNFAYIVSEGEGHGMQVFDLTRLRGVTVPQAWSMDKHVGDFGNAHNIFINEDSGRAHVVGNAPHAGSSTDGGLRVYELEPDPAQPQFVTEINIDGYSHDVQCVIYSGPDAAYTGREICFGSNEDALTVLDVTEPLHASVLARTSYPGVAYAHQGWLSEDQRYFFLNDEVDEINTGERTHLRVFDVSDLDTPQLAAHYYAPTLAIDHNNYVHGRWLHQTNYAAGLRILDIAQPRNPVEAAYFDTQVNNDITDFIGTWSSFAFPSGLVALSDINDGLFVVRPQMSEAASAPDLVVALSKAQDVVAPDVNLAVTALVENVSETAAEDVLLTVHLPRGAMFSSVDAPAGVDCSGGGRVIQCRMASLAAGAGLSIPLGFSAAHSGSWDAYAMAYADMADRNPADNLSVESLIVEGPFEIPPAESSGSGSLLYILPFLGLCLYRRRK